MLKKAGFDQIRYQNRLLILRALRNEQTLARIDIGTHTGLSPAAVTTITADLINEGVVKQLYEVDTKQLGSRGRPRTFLTLNPDLVYVAGIKISVNQVDFVLADFQGTILGSKSFESTTENISEAELLSNLLDDFIAFCNEHEGALDKLFEVVVSAQGVVDTQSGIIKWSPAFTVKNIQIVEPISAKLGVNCKLSNDANLIAQSINLMYPDKYNGTFAVISIDNGVGGGVFINDKLFIGSTGAAAEFGHVTHIPNGNLCRCGKRGCLEAYLGNYGIIRTAQNLQGSHEPTEIDISAEKIKELTQQAHAGEKLPLKAFQIAGTALGYGIARLITTIEPTRIVITGPGSKAFPLMEASMIQAINKSIVKELHEHVKIDPLPWQQDVVLNGIIDVTLNNLDSEVFAHSESNSSDSKVQSSMNEQLKRSESQE